MERFDMGQQITFCGRTMLMGELLSLAKETLDRRAQKKPMPESKPAPEQNCGNCARIGHCALDQFPDADYACWQPKSAEPQEWEQLVRSMAEFAGSTDKHTEKVIAVIRAEIERVREEEKGAIAAFLRGHWLMTDGLAPMAGDIEQNKHRSEK